MFVWNIWDSRCRQGTIIAVSISRFWSFSRNTAVSPVSSHKHSPLFIPPSSCHFIFSFINFMSSITLFMVGKKIYCLVHHSCTIIPVVGGRSGHAACALPLDSVPQWTSSRAEWVGNDWSLGQVISSCMMHNWDIDRSMLASTAGASWAARQVN